MSTQALGVLDLTFNDILDEADLLTVLTEKLSKLELKNDMKLLKKSPQKLDRSSSPVKIRNQSMEFKALRLSNNIMKDISIICNPLKVKLDVYLIQWLDLSFNHIESIKEIATTTFPNVTTLYLHANRISKLSDVKLLSNFENLKSLSLYGNPIEEKKHYKKYIIYFNSQITQFDSSPITKQDRDQVSVIV